jgi:hypothetical protein
MALSFPHAPPAYQHMPTAYKNAVTALKAPVNTAPALGGGSAKIVLVVVGGRRLAISTI